MARTGSSLPPKLAAFAYRLRMSTRWKDNDQYGHVNNAVHYSWCDSLVNHLILTTYRNRPATTALPKGLVVHSSCTYMRSLSYPQDVMLGLRVDRIGRTSVTYAIGIFGVIDDPSSDGTEECEDGGGVVVGPCAALASFTHVYVDAAAGDRPAPLDPAFRARLVGLQTAANSSSSSRL